MSQLFGATMFCPLVVWVRIPVIAGQKLIPPTPTIERLA